MSHVDSCANGTGDIKNLKLQNLLIVVSSYIFYGWWDWRFLSLIILSTAVDYFVGINLSKENNITRRKILLLISIILNIGLLGFFKYYNFFIENFTNAFSFFGKKINTNSLTPTYTTHPHPTISLIPFICDPLNVYMDQTILYGLIRQSPLSPDFGLCHYSCSSKRCNVHYYDFSTKGDREIK